MRCPECDGRTTVVDSRVCQSVNAIRRRRKCISGCKERFTTYETTTSPLRTIELNGESKIKAIRAKGKIESLVKTLDKIIGN